MYLSNVQAPPHSHPTLPSGHPTENEMDSQRDRGQEPFSGGLCSVAGPVLVLQPVPCSYGAFSGWNLARRRFVQPAGKIRGRDADAAWLPAGAQEPGGMRAPLAPAKAADSAYAA